MTRTAALLVVGGGPAGLTTAIAALHADPSLRGRVVVLEKERYPREKICAGGIGARAERVLARFGVEVRVPHVAIDGVVASLARGDVMVRERGMGRVVRRAEFDAALADEARARGVVIVEGARAQRIDARDEGVRVVTDVGDFDADALVGADGVGSVVRRALGLPFGKIRAQVVEIDTEPTPRDGARDLFAFDLRDRSYSGYTWDFPTIVDGRAMVCRGAYVLHRDGDGDGDRAPPDPKDVLDAHVRARGLSLANYRIKRFSERAYDPGLAIARPRVLLAGEAAGIEPLLGEGIAHAILYGARAGRYVAPRLAARKLAFRSWNARITTAPRVGVDVAARTLMAALFYGAGHEHIARFLHESPAFLRGGARYFAGKPFGRDVLASGGAGVLAAARASIAILARSSGARMSAWREAARELSSTRP